MDVQEYATIFYHRVGPFSTTWEAKEHAQSGIAGIGGNCQLDYRAFHLSLFDAPSSAIWGVGFFSSIAFGWCCRGCSVQFWCRIKSSRSPFIFPFSLCNHHSSIILVSSDPCRVRYCFTPSAAPNLSSYDAVAIELPSLPDALGNVRLPGLRGGLNSSRPGDTVTTISSHRSADHAVSSKEQGSRVTRESEGTRPKTTQLTKRRTLRVNRSPIETQPRLDPLVRRRAQPAAIGVFA